MRRALAGCSDAASPAAHDTRRPRPSPRCAPPPHNSSSNGAPTRKDGKPRSAGRGGRLLDEFDGSSVGQGRDARGDAAGRDGRAERNALQRPAHVAAAARGVRGARRRAWVRAWLAAQQPGSWIDQQRGLRRGFESVRSSRRHRARREAAARDAREECRARRPAYAGAIRAGVDGLLDAALSFKGGSYAFSRSAPRCGA